MRILAINGSSRPDESNFRFLRSLGQHFNQYKFEYTDVTLLPLFRAKQDHAPWPEEVLSFRSQLSNSDAVVISTPEYIHNIPATLKNALEWITSSGELYDKPTLAITYCPHAPRGERAMISLLQSLQALNARVKLQMSIYQDEFRLSDDNIIIDQSNKVLIEEAISTLLT